MCYCYVECRFRICHTNTNIHLPTVVVVDSVIGPAVHSMMIRLLLELV